MRRRSVTSVNLGGGGGRGGRGGRDEACRTDPGRKPGDGPLATCCERVIERPKATSVSTWPRRSGQTTISESILVEDPNPKCKRGSTDDWKPRVGNCSSICSVPPCLMMTFAPIPAVFAPEPRNTTCR